jgi:hypothetical protein
LWRSRESEWHGQASGRHPDEVTQPAVPAANSPMMASTAAKVTEIFIPAKMLGSAVGSRTTVNSRKRDALVASSGGSHPVPVSVPAPTNQPDQNRAHPARQQLFPGRLGYRGLSASRSKDTYLAAKIPAHRRPRGPMKAILALEHSILTRSGTCPPMANATPAEAPTTSRGRAGP